MTREEVAKRPEFQRLRQKAAEYGSILRLIVRAYNIDLGLPDPKLTAEVLTTHVADELARRETIARLSSKDRAILNVGK